MTANQSKAGEGRGVGPAVTPGRGRLWVCEGRAPGESVLAFTPLTRHSALRGSGLFHTGPPPVLPWFSSPWHRPRGAGADPVGTGPAQDGPYSKCQRPSLWRLLCCPQSSVCLLGWQIGTKDTVQTEEVQGQGVGDGGRSPARSGPGGLPQTPPHVQQPGSSRKLVTEGSSRRLRYLGS